MFSIEECRRMFLFCIGGGLLLEWLEVFTCFGSGVW